MRWIVHWFPHTSPEHDWIALVKFLANLWNLDLWSYVSCLQHPELVEDYGWRKFCLNSVFPFLVLHCISIIDLCYVCLRTSKIQVWGCDLHLFVAQIVLLITGIKWLRKPFVAFNVCFHVFRLIMWVEVIRHKKVHFDYFWAHFREEDKKSTVAFRHQSLHKFTFGRWCHWRPWRIEKRKENEEITFSAIFPANNHHKRRHNRRKQPPTVVVRQWGSSSHDCWTIPMWPSLKSHFPHAKSAIFPTHFLSHHYSISPIIFHLTLHCLILPIPIQITTYPLHIFRTGRREEERVQPSKELSSSLAQPSYPSGRH